jgi:hypothetical protein
MHNRVVVVLCGFKTTRKNSVLNNGCSLTNLGSHFDPVDCPQFKISLNCITFKVIGSNISLISYIGLGEINISLLGKFQSFFKLNCQFFIKFLDLTIFKEIQ